MTPASYNPLMVACENGRWQIVEFLLQLPGIDVYALIVNGDSARTLTKNQVIGDLIDKYT